MAIRIALVQVDCSSTESLSARSARVPSMVREVAGDVDMVILPELWQAGAFDTARMEVAAEPLAGPTARALGELAAEHGVWVHGGSICEQTPEGQRFNTSLLIGPDGQLHRHYRKIHLFGFDGGETALLSAGEDLVVAHTPLGATGLATCYDLRFPELFRALTERGATAVLLTSGWPRVRLEHWDVLTRARAIENQYWVIACNQVGEQHGVVLGGGSVVIDPRGDVVARAGVGEEILVAEVDPLLSEQARGQFPVLNDIRLR